MMYLRCSQLALFVFLASACGANPETFARAIISGDRPAVQKMLAEGANPDGRFGGDPLILIAAHKGRSGIVQDLIAADAAVLTRITTGGQHWLRPHSRTTHGVYRH